MKRLVPLNDNVIVRVIENETVTAGGIVLPGSAVEKSTRAEVMVANQFSYHRNGDLRDPLVRAGDIVVMQSGNVGTTVADAPKGETWLAVPEDCIYFKVESHE